MSDVYRPFIQLCMNGGTINSQRPDLLTSVVRAVFVDLADYTVDLDAHDFLADIPAGARVATSGPLLSKTFTGNVFDAADITVSSVTGDQFEAVVITAEPTTGADQDNTALVAYIDSGTGLAFTPNGSDVDITWPGGGIIDFNTP